MEEDPQPSTSASTSSSINSTSKTNINNTNTESNPTPTASGSSSSSKTDNPSGKSRSRHSSDSDPNSDEKTFECNICLDVAKDAVVSYCGHLFCWPCLHQWLETRPSRQSCPVCKAAVSKDKVIPLYGRGGSGVDPRSKVPPRPQATRTEQPETSHRFAWGGNGDGGSSFHMSFGIGAFPFGFFASAYNWGRQGPAVGGANFVDPEQLEQQEFLHKIFLWIAVIFIIWLIYL